MNATRFGKRRAGNATATGGPIGAVRSPSLGDIPRRSAARHPTRTAVVHRAGTRRAADVIAHCRAAPAGDTVPTFVVVLDELSRNPSGKIVKLDLRGRFSGLADT
ncbi:hypothetical protein GCM10023094_17790 [Rhodococcus olei]|uniref:AMP-binding enzyme C-terminal domain-containing protein n=1 Tax=Rhodococcus olei TaxID=2161675 RepID=A0ABP8P0R1_9NOCA